MSDCLTPLELFLESTRGEDKIQNHHRPSSARIEGEGEVYGECLLAQYYKWKGLPPTNPIELKGLHNFWCGHNYEDAYEKGLQIAKTEYQKEYPFQSDLGLKNVLSGRLDFVIKTNNHWEGVEIKTAYGQGMTSQKKNGLPKEGYILQMMCYLEKCPLNLSCIHNPTYARDSFYRLPFELYRNEDGTFAIIGNLGEKHIPWTFEMIKQSWAKLENYLEKEETPPKDYNIEDKKQSWHCKYCAYQNKCWSNNKGE